MSLATATPTDNALRHPSRVLDDSGCFRSSRTHVGLSAARIGARAIGAGWLGPARRRLVTCSASWRSIPPRISDSLEKVFPIGHRIEEVGRQYLCLTAGGGRAGGRAPCEGCGYQW